MGTGAKIIAGRRVRWDSARADQAYSQGWWIRGTLADALHRATLESPGRTVIVDGDTRLTLSALRSQAMMLAQAMLDRLKPSSVVSFMLPNWHEAAVIYHAATIAGMVVHPLLPSLRHHELRFMLEDVDSRMIFIPSALRNHDYREMMARVTAELSRPPLVVVVRGEPGSFIPYPSLFDDVRASPLPSLESDAVHLVLYTSGTTGTPKGVLHSHNSIHALIRQIGQHWLVSPADTFLVASPVSHIGGSIYAFECPLLLGTRAVLMERWDPDAAVGLALSEHCTHIAGATPFLEQLLAATRRAGTRLPDLKLFICGGAAVPPSLIREAAEYFAGAAVTRVYGSTEVPVTTLGTLDRADRVHAAETDGRVGIAEVRLTDPMGNLNNEGEIRVRGPQMLVGYLHAEDEDGAFDAEGFYRTGDLGRWVDGEHLLISGRLKDIIIRNGENISPKEIEDLLVEHPGIAEVTVVGVPDRRTGERACAVIIPRKRPAPDLESLQAFLLGRGVAVFKFPEEVFVWEALPKNDAGKVLKYEIRAQLMRQVKGG